MPGGSPAGRPLLVGVVHGLAGSGALSAVAIAASPDAFAAFAAVVLYAVGALIGMTLLASVAGPMLARVARAASTARALVLVAGSASVVLGLIWGGRSLVALASL